MRQIAVFNNKGGAGKSTLTVFMADFASSLHMKTGQRAPRILVLDVDDQSSSATALLGRDEVRRMKREGRTFGHTLRALLDGDAEAPLHVGGREVAETDSRKTPLVPIDVALCDAETITDLDEQHSNRILGVVMRRFRALLADYDCVFADFHARVRPADHVAMALLASSTHVVVPTEVTDIAVSPLQDSFRVIDDARALARQMKGERGPAALGVVMNKANRSYGSYKRHFPELGELARRNGTAVLSNLLPTASALMTATDGSLDFATIRDKYDTYYDHVRKVTKEVLRIAQEGGAGS